MSKQGSLGKFGVEPSFSYESFPLTPAMGELDDVAQKLRSTMSVQRPGVTDKRAVWIVHGMGQQVPYETLEQLANGLIDAAEDSIPGARVGPPSFARCESAKPFCSGSKFCYPGLKVILKKSTCTNAIGPRKRKVRSN